MLKGTLRNCTLALEQGGINDAAFEAVCIVEHVTGYSRAEQLAHANEPLTQAQTEKILGITQKRLTRYPLQYLLHSWPFMGFNLSVGEGVLIPRDDTEVCARLCLRFLHSLPQPHKAKALDLCAGTGAIGIALSKLTGASVDAVELSEAAYKFLIKNINAHKAKVTPHQGDITVCYTDFKDKAYDLIVSNPPYIPSGELAGLQTEVQHEPALALDGGEDGCDFYRLIIKHWSQKLKPGGAMALELGEGQAEPVAAMMTEAGFADIHTENDFGGTQRAIIGTMLAK